MSSTAYSYDPEAVRISVHARERYCERRRTKPEFADDAIRRLLRRGAAKPLLPVATHAGGHQVNVGEMCLILSPDCRTLITFAWPSTVKTWKGLKRAKHGRPRRSEDEEQ